MLRSLWRKTTINYPYFAKKFEFFCKIEFFVKIKWFFASKITFLVLRFMIYHEQQILLCPNCLICKFKRLVVKGSTFVHGEEFLPIFQIIIFLFLEYRYITSFSNVTSICPKHYSIVYCTQLSCHVPKTSCGEI